MYRSFIIIVSRVHPGRLLTSGAADEVVRSCACMVIHALSSCYLPRPLPRDPRTPAADIITLSATGRKDGNWFTRDPDPDLTLTQNFDFSLIWEVERVQGVQEGQRRKGARCCGVTLSV